MNRPRLRFRTPWTRDKPPEHDRDKKVQRNVAYVTSAIVLGIWLATEPVMIAYNAAQGGTPVEYSLDWRSTLTNMAMMGFGVLLGRAISEAAGHRGPLRGGGSRPAGRIGRRRRSLDGQCPECGYKSAAADFDSINNFHGASDDTIG